MKLIENLKDDIIKWCWEWSEAGAGGGGMWKFRAKWWRCSPPDTWKLSCGMLSTFAPTNGQFLPLLKWQCERPRNFLSDCRGFTINRHPLVFKLLPWFLQAAGGCCYLLRVTVSHKHRNLPRVTQAVCDCDAEIWAEICLQNSHSARDTAPQNRPRCY